MSLTERENYLKAVKFDRPEWIPVSLLFAPVTWKRYREELENVVLEHPAIFPGYAKGSIDFDNAAADWPKWDPDGARFVNAGDYYRDGWGCLWHGGYDGLGGQPVDHPLADWKSFKNFQPLDILHKNRWGEDRDDWDVVKRRLEGNKKQGKIASARIPCFFDRLHYLRGFENLLCDFAEDPPELARLIEMVLETNMKLVEKLLQLDLDIVDHHGDIGTQQSLMFSPATFRKYLKPGYARMFEPFRKAGIPVRYSSDGKLLNVIDDLVESGVSTHDPQFTVNTLDGIEKAYKGKLCAVVDFGQEIALMSPEEIRVSIAETVRRLGAPEGGLVVRGWAISDVPLENVKAFCSAAEEFCLRR
jgi:uroporphyrinogen decarboxylase